MAQAFGSSRNKMEDELGNRIEAVQGNLSIFIHVQTSQSKNIQHAHCLFVMFEEWASEDTLKLMFSNFSKFVMEVAGGVSRHVASNPAIRWNPKRTFGEVDFGNFGTQNKALNLTLHLLVSGDGDLVPLMEYSYPVGQERAHLPLARW